MKRKLILIVCTLLAAAFSLGAFAGCDLLVTDNEKDMAQVVAEVNVASDPAALEEAFASLGLAQKELSPEVEEKLGEIVSTDEIYKRDLVTYFLSYGYNYISSGYTYAETFELLLTGLADRKLVSQFATLYYLSAGSVTVDSDYVEQFEQDAAAAGYENIAESDGYRMDKTLRVADYLAAVGAEGLTADEAAIAGYSYLLSDAEIAYAEYLVKSGINSAIDSYEEQIISEEETETSEETRATPSGMNTLAAYYYPADYAIYTGLNEEADCGEYEALEGSRRATRRLAYARFITYLRESNLVEEEESVSDPVQLAYYNTELKAQLEQLVIAKFSSTISLTMSDAIEQAALERAYSDLVASQQVTSASEFTSTMDSVSDTSFVVYSPAEKVYGFVYNILLPFNDSQEMRLAEIKSRYGTDTAAYYANRKSLYSHILATDQRGSWFNGSEDYSFDASESALDYYKTDANSDYLFFEDSLTKSATGIARYAGLYPYNGTVNGYDEETKTYDLTPAELDVDAFIAEFNAYVGKVSGAAVNGSKAAAYDSDETAIASLLADKDYSFAIYYEGSVAGVKEVSAADYLVKSNVSYKALSAVNELMFAYTTDTAGLNSYYGYSIDTIQEATSYVPEFEYAAQKLITDKDGNYGRGSYCVVATDYGWHLIYVTFTYEGGAVYYSDDDDDTNDGFLYAQRNEDGTFSYYFYRAMKSSVVSSYTEDKQNELVDLLEEQSVTFYKNRYSDLTSIDA